MSILRLPAVKAETGWRSHASIYKAVEAGLFTKPVQLGERAIGWPADEVKMLCSARIGGATDEQIRVLVKHLHQKRAELLEQLSALA